jgi:hypothetical protein
MELLRFSWPLVAALVALDLVAVRLAWRAAVVATSDHPPVPDDDGPDPVTPGVEE